MTSENPGPGVIMTGQRHCIKLGTGCRAGQPDRRQRVILEKSRQIKHHNKDRNKRGCAREILSNGASAAGNRIFNLNHVGVLCFATNSGWLRLVDPLFSNLSLSVKNFLRTFVNKMPPMPLTH